MTSLTLSLTVKSLPGNPPPVEAAGRAAAFDGYKNPVSHPNSLLPTRVSLSTLFALTHPSCFTSTPPDFPPPCQIRPPVIESPPAPSKSASWPESKSALASPSAPRSPSRFSIVTPSFPPSRRTCFGPFLRLLPAWRLRLRWPRNMQAQLTRPIIHTSTRVLRICGRRRISETPCSLLLSCDW